MTGRGKRQSMPTPPEMASVEPLDILKQGAEVWNRWRKENPAPEPDLTGADLQDIDLRGADLRGAILKEANLLRCTLREAVLQDADLQNAKGLLSDQLGGANLAGAKLPEAVAKFEGLATVEEICKDARQLFGLMLLACIFSVLTIVATSDVVLITNSASHLAIPNVGVPIPSLGFYMVGPLLLLGLYYYFHFYLQDLWERLASLPAVFPGGVPLDKMAYPWIAVHMGSLHIRKLSETALTRHRFRDWTFIFLAWWAVPLSSVLFWVRYLPVRNWTVTNLHIVLVVAATASAYWLQRLATATLRGEKRDRFVGGETLKKTSFYGPLVVILGVGALIGWLSYGAINGLKPGAGLDKTEAFGGFPSTTVL